jgi:hypothetical protein
MSPWFWVVNQNSEYYLNLIANEPSSGFGLSLKVQNFTITSSSGF